jgi:hypothetical protein
MLNDKVSTQPGFFINTTDYKTGGLCAVTCQNVVVDRIEIALFDSLHLQYRLETVKEQAIIHSTIRCCYRLSKLGLCFAPGHENAIRTHNDGGLGYLCSVFAETRPDFARQRWLPLRFPFPLQLDHWQSGKCTAGRHIHFAWTSFGRAVMERTYFVYRASYEHGIRNWADTVMAPEMISGIVRLLDGQQLFICLFAPIACRPIVQLRTAKSNS